MNANTNYPKPMAMYSLIAPAYNEAHHIRGCVQNIVEQFDNYGLNFEFIIVDDCSTDSTYEELLAIDDQRIRIFRTTHNSGGAGAPRNLGLSKAVGKYLLFYDFGDVIDLSKVEEIVCAMEEHGSPIGIANHVDIHPDENIYPCPLKIFRDLSYAVLLRDVPKIIHNPFCWGKIFNRSWIQLNNIKFGSQYCGEDKIFTWKSYLLAPSITIHPHILYGHRFYGGHINRMLQRNSKLAESIVSIDEELYSLFELYGLEYIYAKRVLHRDLLGIILDEKSIEKLIKLNEYEETVRILNTWLQEIMSERTCFSGALDLRQRYKLANIFGGIFSVELQNDRDFYQAETYIKCLHQNPLETDPSKKDNYIIALHLPQFHPDPINDANWGKGFTEWSNVTKAKPLYSGHLQPKLPSDLGYYDLRLHESRIEQMRLAKYHGVDAFCYYHYWFSGKTVLEQPLRLMLANPKENFPFMLCWANETWTGIWHGCPNRILIKQDYSGVADFTDYFHHLIPFFKDSRYLKIDGRPLFAVWQPTEISEPHTFLEIFNRLAREHGFDGIHMIGMDHWHKKRSPLSIGFDRSVPLHMPPRLDRQGQGPTICDFELIHGDFQPQEFGENLYPCITPNWDNTPRSNFNGMVFENNHPGLFHRQLKNALNWSQPKHSERILFIKAWNEWAEGNYLEPDSQWGRAYLSILKKTLENRIAI